MPVAPEVSSPVPRFHMIRSSLSPRTISARLHHPVQMQPSDRDGKKYLQIDPKEQETRRRETERGNTQGKS
jgi:hypothetical protein